MMSGFFMAAGVVLGATVVYAIWRTDRKMVERELERTHASNQALLQMVRAQNNKLVAKDLAAYTALTETEKERAERDSWPRDDRTEYILAGNGR